MRVAVIGAGLAGLSAARSLTALGHEAKVFESESRVGGRLQTVAIDGFVFDAAATSIAPLGQGLERVILNELPTDDLVTIGPPVVAHDGFRAVSGGVTASKTKRYVYRQGIAECARLLAKGLCVQVATPVDYIEPVDNAYLVAGESFDAAIVAVPAPLADSLLREATEGRRLGNVRYRSCLSVLLGYTVPLQANYHAMVGPDQVHPLSWLSLESVKCPGRAPEGCSAIVAQLSSEYSRRRYDADVELVIEETLGDVARLLGKEFASPKVAALYRYRYSHPESTVTFETVNSPLSRLVVAGDGLLGGRTELAFETGLRAANLLAGQ